jgi:hypothetical protein
LVLNVFKFFYSNRVEMDMAVIRSWALITVTLVTGLAGILFYITLQPILALDLPGPPFLINLPNLPD